MRIRMLAAGFAVVCMALLGSGCDTKKKVDTALDKVSKLLDEYTKLGKSLNGFAGQAKAAATNVATSVKPQSLAKVAPLPPAATGGVNITQPMNGKQGSLQHDMDGDGQGEQVQVFVDDQGILYEAWDGTDQKADGWEDDGLCYLAIDNDSSLTLIISECGVNDGAWVCQLQDAGGSCSACNTAGQCTPCTADAECAWPTGATPDVGPLLDEGPEEDAGVDDLSEDDVQL